MQSPFASPRALFGSLAIAALAAVGITALASGSTSAGPNGGAQVRMLDNCDPATFNAAVGPGTCITSSGGGVTFPTLLATVAATGAHPDWKFKDSTITMSAGTSLLVQDRGGETHSFTEVSVFGTGIVPPLNNPIQGAGPAVPVDPAGVDATFVPTGGSLTITGLSLGKHMFQCLIHPWMRTTVTVVAKS